MQLTAKQVSKFQELYKRSFGKEISKENAYEQGVKLLRLMSLVYKPITKNDYEKYSKEVR